LIFTVNRLLYFVRLCVQGVESGKVEQTKDGPVHDVQWSPDGEKFVMIAGKMPAQVTLFNAKAEAVYQFGASPRNTIIWSPHGRFLCIAGFGNLAGEMDFYDVLRLKKIGSNTTDCATRYGWSADSRYFLAASLAPRMNVDNNMKIFRYNGDGPLLKLDFDRAYEAIWAPAMVGVFPNRGPSPGRSQVSQLQREERAKATIKPAPYRPPRSNGVTSNMMARDTTSVPVGKVKAGTTTATATAAAAAPTASVAKFVPSVKTRAIPGMGAKPAGASNANPAARGANSNNNNNNNNANNRQTPAVQQAKPTNNNNNNTNNSAASKPAAAVPAVAAPVETAADREKRAKAIQKKLKQIDEIKARIATGQVIEPEQVIFFSYTIL
jgi:translation initiation factor 2A